MGKNFNQGDESFVHGKVLCTNKRIEKGTNKWKDIVFMDWENYYC